MLRIFMVCGEMQKSIGAPVNVESYVDCRTFRNPSAEKLLVGSKYVTPMGEMFEHELRPQSLIYPLLPASFRMLISGRT
jgi:hypothetical protein